ncbi:MAG TPA: aminomethyl-transferring glycine dehydrogenase subunit GcvPA [Myxococcota bacterium]|nr:aminomethyl-transferring glycine dehydrogenase subunit GcvPA [Myxococcota bacterium]
MRFIPHTDDDVRGMLAAIGAPDVGALFDCVPEKLRLRRALALPAAGSEQEVLAELGALAAQNVNAASHAWFLGAGTYAHFVPSAVDALASRGEFYTAYTPYQAEISQGTLQTIFEWQTMMAALTGMEVSNASMYDGASATAEAALMALRTTRRRKVAVSAALHPHYRGVLATYLGGLDAEIVEIPRDADGRTAGAALDRDTACVIVQQPNFLGCIEDLAAAAEAAHAAGALLVSVTTEALSLALLRAPGDCGADIACGEAQSFGVPMSFGGPHVGFLATHMANVRQLPGRLVGQTEDARGKRGFVLTLSTREQHIRRERATSNICTNQGLCLLMATIYLALHGRRGLRALAEQNLAKAEYAKARLAAAGATPLFAAPSFNEFAVAVPGSAEAALARAQGRGIVGGLDLARFAPELGPALLVCATELTSRAQIDALADAVGGR